MISDWKTSNERGAIMRALMILLSLAVLNSVNVSAADYYPLNEGNTWTYLMDDGSVKTVTVTSETQVVQGVVTKVVEVTAGDTAYQQYMSKDAEGNVYQHGYYYPDTGMQHSYVPPVFVLPADPVAVPEWGTMTWIHGGLNSPSTPLERMGVVCWLEGFEPLTLPAGTFDTVHVDFYRIFSKSETEQLEPGIWYADGVGVVQAIKQVMSAYDVVVSAERSSWSEVKRLFH